MKITVTEEHLHKGVRYSRYKCPIGLACKASRLNVLVGATYLFDETTNQVADLPDNAVDLIAKFDRGKGGTPITFEVCFKPV